jgi:hypothetical protein
MLFLFGLFRISTLLTPRIALGTSGAVARFAFESFVIAVLRSLPLRYLVPFAAANSILFD